MAEIIYPAIAVLGLGGQLAGQMFSKNGNNDPDEINYYDPRNWYKYYYMFPPDCTHMIDEILASPYGVMTQEIMLSQHRRAPGLGYHYYYNKKDDERGFYDNHFNYITFHKKRRTIGGAEIIQYQCITGGLIVGKQDDIFNEVVAKIFRTDSNTIRVISIDMSSFSPKFTHMTEMYHQPKDYQSKAAEWIISSYENNPNNNTKYIISGTRGTGKTFTARVVKSNYLKRHPSHEVHLFSDFDPSVIGVNINDLILNKNVVSAITPVVIVLDEIDEIFKHVYQDKDNHDPRVLHTRTKTSFNRMMDVIGSTPNVIFIGTTELPLETLYEDERFHSFMRIGRIDHFIEMSQDYKKTKLVKHKDIIGYPKDSPTKL